LTNAHVVENCQQIWARTSEGSKASAGILAKSPADDLAVLKVKSSVRIPAVLRVAPSLRMGEPIIVYGFPMSGLLNSSGNATTGDIGALAGIQNRASWLQISAPVQPGNPARHHRPAQPDSAAIQTCLLDFSREKYASSGKQPGSETHTGFNADRTIQLRFLGRIEAPESNPRRPSSRRRGWLSVMCQRTRAASSRVYWLSDRRVESFIRSTSRL